MKTTSRLLVVSLIFASYANAENLSYLGNSGDSSTALAGNWIIQGTTENKVAGPADDCFLDSNYALQNTQAIFSYGGQTINSLTVKSDFAGYNGKGEFTFRNWNSSYTTVSLKINNALTVEGSAIHNNLYFGANGSTPSETEFSNNMSISANEIVVGGNLSGGTATLNLGNVYKNQALKSVTVGSESTGGNVKIDATYGNSNLTFNVIGSASSDYSPTNPAAKIYGTLSMKSADSFESKATLLNQIGTILRPGGSDAAKILTYLQSLSDFERKANIQVGALSSSGSANTIYAINTATKSGDTHFAYNVNLVIDTKSGTDEIFSGGFKKIGTDSGFSAYYDAADVAYTLYKKGEGTQTLKASDSDLSGVVVSDGTLKIANTSGTFGAINAEGGKLSVIGSATADSFIFNGGELDIDFAQFGSDNLHITGDFKAENGAIAKMHFVVSGSAELDTLYEIAFIDGDFGFQTDENTNVVSGIETTTSNGYIANLYYDTGTLSVMYTVPEPAEIAVLIGALSIALAAFRRRK